MRGSLGLGGDSVNVLPGTDGERPFLKDDGGTDETLSVFEPSKNDSDVRTAGESLFPPTKA